MNRGRFFKLLNFKYWLFNHKLKRIAKFFDFIVRFFLGCDIPSSVQLGSGGQFPHCALGIVIHPRAKIGNDFKIYQNVTIGSRKGSGPPLIGDSCYIGAGACILGEIRIGDNVTIGANAVVLCDVPDNSVAVGVPAVVKTKKNLAAGTSD